jgi:antitoxin YobK
MPQPSDRYVEVARQFREASADDAGTFTPATLEDLTTAQEALGCRFPDSYTWFQLEFGDVSRSLLDIYTVRPADPPNRNIVGINLLERQEGGPRLPSHLIAFSDSGGGDLYCFDTSAFRDGECPVVWWDHELDEDQSPEPAAPSFLDWIESELRERAAEEPGSLLDSLAPMYDSWMREWFKKK